MASRPSQEEEDASMLKLGEDFEKAKCLMNFEVLQLLKQKQEMSKDTEVPENPVFEKSLAYVERFSRYQNPEAVTQVRELLGTRYKLKEFEVCVIGNLNPEGLEEVKALVPSLTVEGRDIDDEKIYEMLADMATIKKFE